jgi:hypothetical protein
MAILGTGGILELSREWPEPMALAPSAINYSASPVRIALGNLRYWTGDRILFTSASGVPLDLNGDGYADNPEGHGIYRGGEWLTGPSRAYYTGPETDNSPFYERFPAYLTTQAGDNLTTQDGDQFFVFTGQDGGKHFYNRTADTGLSTQFSAYINIDDLDRIRLFSDEISAHNLTTANEITPLKVKIDNFVISRYSANSTYTSALNTAANTIKPLALPNESQELQDVITPPSALATVADDPDSRGWLVQCDLQEWAFSIDAANLDMTAIGETFGENAKSLVRGAGSLTFLVDQRYVDGEQTSMTLLRLVTLTEKQAKSSAKFHIYRDRTPTSPQVGTTAYYGCDVLLTNTRINVRADDIITGTADFVATGEIALKFAP